MHDDGLAYNLSAAHLTVELEEGDVLAAVDHQLDDQLAARAGPGFVGLPDAYVNRVVTTDRKASGADLYVTVGSAGFSVLSA